MRRLMLIMALLVIVPIIEIAVLIAVGQVIGLGWTLLLMFGTSALGAWLLRREGGKAWRAFQDELQSGRPPGHAATNGLLVLIGGIFMLVPGFVSDIIGLFLIAPPTRPVARAFVLRALWPRMSSSTASALFGPRRVRVRYGARHDASTPNGAQPQRAPEPIEGEIIE
jgi:UPF0716 protein FxsA